jgi:MoaA/NifB/PqqE/SkfB family radical SAM enzyme/SAM-dependent methyltransferase
MKGTEFFERFAARPPLSKAHPAVGAFFKDYLKHEKATEFGGRYVINTHMPPYPGRAFERFVELFAGGVKRRLYSVTLAVTNRCSYRCWHCYNAGRSQEDMPLETIRPLAAKLQDLGATMVTLTGGEPLIRKDLAQIAAAFDDRTTLVLNTTGGGLTAARASELKASGLFALGVSLDSIDPAEHDRMRGREGAWRTALNALTIAHSVGLYPYAISLATREFLEPERFHAFLEFARDAGALEVHVLEPTATGRLAGRSDVLLDDLDRRRILEYQAEYATREDMPTVSSFAYLESADAFGCGAGLTHMYVDGCGEVGPCNLVPISFGNVLKQPLESILDEMARHFSKPRTCCIGRILGPHIPKGSLPTPPEVSHELCRKYLPAEHDVPLFFQIAGAAVASVGKEELRSAYDTVHSDYDEFWLKEAARPIHELIDALDLKGHEKVFEAGCGTGYATIELARKLARGGEVTAVDLSAGMLSEARKRAEKSGAGNVQFHAGDALELLTRGEKYDVVFSSWVLGYIPLEPFFAAASSALRRAGRLAFVVHRENSPREALEIFGELVAEDPAALEKRVEFDFPVDGKQVAARLAAAGFTAVDVREGAAVFRYASAREVLEHLLKSGAGTAFYHALRSARRESFERRFVDALDARHTDGRFEVAHEYVACIARKA